MGTRDLKERGRRGEGGGTEGGGGAEGGGRRGHGEGASHQVEKQSQQCVLTLLWLRSSNLLITMKPSYH